MKRFLLLILLITIIAVGVTATVMAAADRKNQADVEELQTIHRTYLDAWSNQDMEVILDIGDIAGGFGVNTAFPRPVRVREPFRKMATQFFDSMDLFKININTENYRVVGDTGMAWGHYAQTTKQKDGPQRTIYLRYAHTFARIDGSWKLVMYHRSLIPNEDFQ